MRLCLDRGGQRLGRGRAVGQAAHDRRNRRRGVGQLNRHSRLPSQNRESERMQRTAPPFRADHVGSLLRTAALKEAREKRKRGELSEQALKEIEDREIEALIRKQEDIG